MNSKFDVLLGKVREKDEAATVSSSIVSSSGFAMIPAVEGVVYTYTPVSSDVLTIGNPVSGHVPTFELAIANGATIVSWSFSNTIVWGDESGHFESATTAPSFDVPNIIYHVVFRWSTSGRLLGYVAFTEEVVTP